MSEKNYVGNGWERSTQYGIFTSLSLNLEKLNGLPTDKYGNIRLTLGRLKTPNKTSKATHWIAEDTYRRENNINNNQSDDYDIPNF